MNEQQQFWNGKEGDEYPSRNASFHNIEYSDGTRLSVFKSFFQDLPRDISILELGCGPGNIIRTLKQMGFTNLTGIDINAKAIGMVEREFPEFTFIHSAIEDLPPVKKYDLVFTSGVLIHIHPNNVSRIINKMKTLARKWIFGFEYYSEITMHITYRKKEAFCWSGNYADMFGMTPTRLEIHDRLKWKGQDCFYLFSLLS